MLDPTRLERSVLQHTKETDLRRERQLGDLVEEERPAVGALEPPEASGGGAGEAAALVTEELGVDELRRDGSAVDADHRSATAPRARVNHPRDELLAGAGLSFEHHRRVRRRDVGDARDDVAKAGAGPDDVAIVDDGFHQTRLGRPVAGAGTGAATGTIDDSNAWLSGISSRLAFGVLTATMCPL